MANSVTSFVSASPDARIQALRNAIASGDCSGSFPGSLLSHWDKRGSLSPKQWAWCGVLSGKYPKAQVKAAVSAFSADGVDLGAGKAKDRGPFDDAGAKGSKGARKAPDGPTCTVAERALLDAIQSVVTAPDFKRGDTSAAAKAHRHNSRRVKVLSSPDWWQGDSMQAAVTAYCQELSKLKA